MKLPCEVAVRSAVPAIRALLAKELTENHGMKQMEAADLLGITQTAVSKYTHHVRGSILPIEKEEEVFTLVRKIAASLAGGELNRAELILQICAACKLIRKKRLMCELCKYASSTETQECFICIR